MYLQKAKNTYCKTLPLFNIIQDSVTWIYYAGQNLWHDKNQCVACQPKSCQYSTICNTGTQELQGRGADFDRSVNPMPTRGSRLCPSHNYLPPRVFRPSCGPVIPQTALVGSSTGIVATLKLISQGAETLSLSFATVA